MVCLTFTLLFALAATTHAFVPSVMNNNMNTELSALNRRDALGLAFAGLVAGVLPETASASNPALETFKGGKKTKGKHLKM
jgi:hypothetical protein